MTRFPTAAHLASWAGVCPTNNITGAVAVGHSILVICWHMLSSDRDYADLGGDWFARRTDTDKRRDHLIRQLHDLG